MVLKMGGILSRISLGVVLILVYLWMWTSVPELREIAQFYLIFTAFVFAWDTAVSRKTEQPLFEVAFIRAFPKFLLFAVISLVILFLFGLVYTGNALPSINEAVGKIGLGVILFHAFFVAILEEKVFRNWLPRQLQSRGMQKRAVWVLQAIVFAFFHYTIGKELLSIAVYLPLAFIFMYVRKKYSPKTDMANSGCHFAWNVFILGFLA